MLLGINNVPVEGHFSVGGKVGLVGAIGVVGNVGPLVTHKSAISSAGSQKPSSGFRNCPAKSPVLF